MWHRIGLIVPSSNTVMENDMHRLAPKDVTVHTARIHMVNCTVSEEIEAIEKRLDGAVSDISTVKPRIIVFGCTSASSLGGKGFDLEIAQRIRQGSGCRATTVSTAVLAALNKLGLRKICVVTPYADEINERIKLFLEENGFEVVNIDGMGIVENFRIAEPTPNEIYRFASKAFRKEAEGVFLSCTNFRALDVVQRLEERLNRPVLSSNSAVAWYVFRELGVKVTMDGYGGLLHGSAVSPGSS